MKGLLIKDFHLLKKQKRFFITVVAIAIIMAFSAETQSFILGYITFVLPVFALNTISYDEVDSGYAFLFTLPISRKKYVHEKYCFSLLLGTLSLVLAVCLTMIFGLLKKTAILETIAATPFVFGLMVIMLAVMIPIQLKFGAENGKIALIAFFWIIGALGFGVVQILKRRGIDILARFHVLLELDLEILVAIVVLVAAVVFLLSVRISVAIISKKEY